MQRPKDKIINVATFTPKGGLGQLFARARIFNRLNDQLAELLPKHFKSLSLCAIEANTATFIVENQALAFRAQKQQDELLNIIRTLDALSHIQKVIIKVRLAGY